MNDGNLVEILLTILTIVTGITTVLNFINIRRKDGKKENEEDGELKADIHYIKSVLIDVRQETKEINNLLDNHSERLTRVEESCKQAHKRIDELSGKGDKHNGRA